MYLTHAICLSVCTSKPVYLYICVRPVSVWLLSQSNADVSDGIVMDGWNVLWLHTRCLMTYRSPVSHLSTVSLLWPTNCRVVCAELTLWHPLLAYGYSYIKHPVPDRVKPYSFVIFDIQALWRSALSVRVPGCQKLPMSMGQPGLGVKLLSRWRFIDIARLV